MSERTQRCVSERAEVATPAPAVSRGYRLVYWGALRARLRPYFLRSFIARVAGQEAGLAEREAIGRRIELEEGAGDAVADRTGLAGDAATLDLDHGVEATLGAGHPERHPDVRLVDGVPTSCRWSIVIAKGVVAAARELGIKVPLVVRLEGTNVEQGKKIMADSGLAIVPANDLGDAAKKITDAVKKAG